MRLSPKEFIVYFTEQEFHVNQTTLVLSAEEKEQYYKAAQDFYKTLLQELKYRLPFKDIGSKKISQLL